jgi:hypothetical protein
MLMLSSVLVDENSPLHVRNAAGLALKNTLTARVRFFRLFPIPCINVFRQESGRSTEYANRWMSLSTEAKTKIKNDALLTLGSSSQKAGTFASQVVAAIAAVELPVNQWGDLIEMLLGFVNTQTNVNLRIATLQTIGFICESIVSLTKQLSSATLRVFSRRNLKSSPFAPTKSLLRSSTARGRKNLRKRFSCLRSMPFSTPSSLYATTLSERFVVLIIDIGLY